MSWQHSSLRVLTQGLYLAVACDTVMAMSVSSAPAWSRFCMLEVWAGPERVLGRRLSMLMIKIARGFVLGSHVVQAKDGVGMPRPMPSG